MRSMSEGKSSVTTFNLIPMPDRYPLNHGRHAFAGLVPSIGDNRELNGMSVVIAQDAILKMKSILS